MFEKLNVNWSAFWRKAVVGGLLTAAMGATYKLNKNLDDQIDQRYPRPKDQKNKEEIVS